MMRAIFAIAIVAAMLAISPAQAGVDDQYTVSLMHFNGSLADASGKAWSTLAGAPVATSTQSKFGGGSLYLDGSSALSTPNSTDFDFGDDQWTIEWWQYSTGSNHLLMSRDNEYAPFMSTVDYGAPGIFAVSHEFGLALANIGSNLSGQWSHIAIVKTPAGHLRTYQDGEILYSGSIGAIYSGNGPFMLGRDLTGAFFTGYIDELRISKGIARWTGLSFTPPSAEYIDSAPAVEVGPDLFICGSGKLSARNGGIIYLKE